MKVVAFGLLLMSVGGCASQNMSIRSVPAEDPAAANAAAAENAAAFAAAAATANSEQADAAPGKDADSGAPPPTPITAADAPSMYTYDPWERLNRFTYRFNARFDETIFLPVANTYRRLPTPVRSGVHNFFGNLSEVESVINYTLQWRLHYGIKSLGRFVINSTIGIGGLIDVAKKIKLPPAPTGFSVTLAKWGMHPGPYLVLPLLGPATLRDGVGYLAEYGTAYGIDLFRLYRGDVSWGLGVANAIDKRANVDFRYYASGSAFEYETIRFLYVRKTLIEDSGLHPQKLPPPQATDQPAGK